MTELLTLSRLRELINKNPDYPQETKQFYNYLITNNYDLNPEGVQSYIEYITEAGYRPNTIRVKIAAVKSCIKYLFSNSKDNMDIQKRIIINDYLNNKLKLPKINSNAIEVESLLSEDEINFLIRKVSKKLGVIIYFLYHSGCRISEAVNIKHSDIKKALNYYEITIKGKGDKYRKIKISHNLLNEIKEVYHGKVYLFETTQNKTKSITGGKPINRHYVSNQIKKAGNKWLEKDISAHTFRHCFATRMITSGKSIKAVSKYLGHSSVQTTLDLYVHDSLEFEDLF